MNPHPKIKIDYQYWRVGQLYRYFRSLGCTAKESKQLVRYIKGL